MLNLSAEQYNEVLHADLNAALVTLPSRRRSSSTKHTPKAPKPPRAVRFSESVTPMSIEEDDNCMDISDDDDGGGYNDDNDDWSQ